MTRGGTSGPSRTVAIGRGIRIREGASRKSLAERALLKGFLPGRNRGLSRGYPGIVFDIGKGTSFRKDLIAPLWDEMPPFEGAVSHPRSGPDEPVGVEKIVRMTLKICVVGDRGVGKTSLLNRYVFDTFSEQYEGTLGSHLHLLTFKSVLAGNQLVEAQVALFDLMGERSMRDAFKEVMFWGTNGFLAVADVTRPDTIRALPDWIRTVISIASEVPYAIVMNKVDLAREKAIAPEDTAWLLNKLPGVPYHLTSAKGNLAVQKAFDAVIDAAVGSAMSKTKVRLQRRMLGEKILGFARRRGLMGVGKNDILIAFKGVDYNALMREIEDLRQLGFITVDLLGPSAFRVRITERGEADLERIAAKDRIVEA